jgi:hypothetical protein
MIKKTRIIFEALSLFLLLIVIIGCGENSSGGSGDEFKKSNEGLTMEFVENFPRDSYIVEDDGEHISIMVDIRNEGIYPAENDKDGKGFFKRNGGLFISGFDDAIIDMDSKAKKFSEKDVYLTGASSITPRGGFYSAKFDGKIAAGNLLVDRYEPTILATLCYPYLTTASLTVCVDPKPFEQRQEKVCEIGSKTLPEQGAPVAITRIDQEASTKKIHFKISIENVGGGDIILGEKLEGFNKIIGKCDPLGGGILDRKDFDKVYMESITVGGEDILGDCRPFVDESDNIIRLFDGEGSVICTLDLEKPKFKDIGSAITTPLNIELRYGYRSTISKQIEILKLTSTG